MTSETSEAPKPSTPEALIGAIAWRLANENFPTGEHAALRRMDPRKPGRAAVALHKLLADVGLDPHGESERAWTLIAHCLALARRSYNKAIAAGAALYDLPLTELRLNQLLAADGDVLFDLLPSLARRLDAQGASLNWVQLARLVLTTDPEQADRARVTIARDYARAQSKSELSKETA